MIVECTRPALDKLKQSGLLERLVENKDKWHSALSGMYLSGDFWDIFDKAEEFFKNKYFFKEDYNKIKLYLNIFKLKEIAEEDEFLSQREALIDNPSVLAYLNFGEDMLNYRNYGFESRRQLEEAVTGFCLGEHQNNSSYLWIHGNYKNVLTNSHHGDCWISQTDISENFNNQLSLFENMASLMKDVSMASRGINTPYDYWDFLLTIILKYAKAIGKENIPEITNWREVLDEVGESYTATTESFGTKFNPYFMSWPIIIENQELKKSPISITSDSEKLCLPYVKDRNLLIIKQDESGEIKIPSHKESYFKDLTFSPYLIYEEKELPDLLKATYKLFARDRSRMPKIINLFLEGFPER